MVASAETRRSRGLKGQIASLLRGPDFDGALSGILRIPPRKAVSPLISHFYNPDDTVRWRAVTAAGAVVASLADTDPESARVVMRRFMWSLNDESGGIGWGAPEAMAESMARNKGLAREYACILLSYINEDGNYLEHVPLQRGALWGVGRLLHARPGLIGDAGRHLPPYFSSDDAAIRGHAAWASGAAADPALKGPLTRLLADSKSLTLYIDAVPSEHTVGELAQKALFALGGRSG